MKGFLGYILKSNIFSYSAQSAFYFLFSLFPFLYLLTHIGATIYLSNENILNILKFAFPDKVYNLINYNFETLRLHSTRSVFGFYIILAIWSSSMFLNSLKRATRKNFPKSQNKSYIYNRIFSIIMTIIFAVIICISLFAILIINVLSEFLNSVFEPVITMLIPFLIVILNFVLLYMFLPPERIKVKDAIYGAVFSSVGISLSSFVFSYYINYVANYTMLYGTLGSVIMLMTWLYICSFIIIMGGIINSYIYLKKLSKNIDIS